AGIHHTGPNRTPKCSIPLIPAFYRQLAGRFGTKYRCAANKLRIGHPATTFALLGKKPGFFLAAAACGGGHIPVPKGGRFMPRGWAQTNGSFQVSSGCPYDLVRKDHAFAHQDRAP